MGFSYFKKKKSNSKSKVRKETGKIKIIMATNKQLNKKVKQLEAKLEVQKHKSNYIHIPKSCWKGIGKLFLTILLGFLNYFNFKLILKIFEDYNLGYVFASESEIINHTPKFVDLIISYPLIGEFFLISFTIICFVNIFKKIKSYDEKGLIYGLIVGLIVGPVSCIVAGLIVGQSIGLIAGLIAGLIYGLIYGLIVGLSIGLIGEFN